MKEYCQDQGQYCQGQWTSCRVTAPQMVYSSTSKSGSYLASRLSQCSILRFCVAVAQHQILRLVLLPLATTISALPLSKGSGRKPTILLSLLPKLCDPQSALLSSGCVLHSAGWHLARSIPPTTASLVAFAKFDDDVLHCLECSIEIELTPRACNQAKLGLKYGGLGLRSLAMHPQAAYIVSLSTSLTPIQPSELSMHRLCDAIMVFNGKVACCEQLSVEDVLAISQHQHKLSSAIEKAGFLSLHDGASTVDKARLPAPQAHAWLRAQPSPKLGLDLLPNEVQALVKWWLRLPVFTDADACPHCSQTLDIYGHHALICHAGGGVVTRHNRLRDSFSDFCRRAYLTPDLERGCGLTSTKD